MTVAPVTYYVGMNCFRILHGDTYCSTLLALKKQNKANQNKQKPKLLYQYKQNNKEKESSVQLLKVVS